MNSQPIPSRTTSTAAGPGWIDTHAHLDDDRLLADLDRVRSRAAEAGVEQILAVATTASSSAKVVDLAESCPEILAAVGIHPNHAHEIQPGDWDQVLALVDHPRVVAVGETGLDRYWDFTPWSVQQEWFARHLELAHTRGKPVIIHCRECEADLLQQLSTLNRPVRGVLHSFSGNWEQAQAFLGLGLHLSFAGQITFSNKSLDGLRDAAARVPLDRLLVETDSPYLSPHPHRGKVNEPARVVATATRLAQLRGLELSRLAEITSTNARNLFQLPPSRNS